MKFEYGDFYKFVVSLGVALIALSLVTPWLFLREPFDLLVPEFELQALTPSAPSIIIRRQRAADIALNVLPWFIVVCFACGLALILRGGWLWFRRSQQHLDEQQEIATIVARKQLHPATPERIEQARQSEAEHALLEVGGGPGTGFVELYSDIIASVETKLIQAFQRCLPHIKVLSRMQLDDLYFDLVLHVDSSNDWLHIIDVKYSDVQPDKQWILDRVYSLAYQIGQYREKTGRKADGHVIVVVPYRAIPDVNEWGQLPDVTSYWTALNQTIHLCFIPEEELDDPSCSRIATLLAVG